MIWVIGIILAIIGMVFVAQYAIPIVAILIIVVVIRGGSGRHGGGPACGGGSGVNVFIIK